MLEIRVAIDPAALANLAGFIDRLVAESGRTVDDAVTYAGVRVAESGRHLSVEGKTRREIIDNPEWKQAAPAFRWARARRKRGLPIPPEAEAALGTLNEIAPYLIRRLRQGGAAPLMVPSWSKDDPRRVIPQVGTPGERGGRGLAKRTWNVMAGKLAAMRGQSSGPVADVGRWASVSKYHEKWGKTAGDTVVRLTNRLSYLETAYPGITNEAINRGAAALSRELENGVAQMTARANRGQL